MNLLSGLSGEESYMKAYGISNRGSASAGASRLKKIPKIQMFLEYEKMNRLREIRKTIDISSFVREAVKIALDPSNDNMSAKTKMIEMLFNATHLNEGLLSQLEKIETDTERELLIRIDEIESAEKAMVSEKAKEAKKVKKANSNDVDKPTKPTKDEPIN